MKTLCICYSRTGKTKEIMSFIARKTGADYAEYTDGKNRRGALGYLKSCVDSYRAAPAVTVTGLRQPLREYDRIIIGCPVWAEKPCIVLKGLLEQYGKNMTGNVYFVVTHMSKREYEKEINALDDLLPAPHKASLSLRTKGRGATAIAEMFLKEIG